MRRRLATILTIAVISVAVVLLLQALSSEPDPTEEAAEQPVACEGTRQSPPGGMTFEAPADMEIAEDATVTATLVTSCGTITVQLDQVNAPTTVNSFAFLADEGFYNGTLFHRIIEDFMVQGGDPAGTGSGGPGYTIADEYPEPDFEFSEGVMAMANAGRPNSTGSQFFIVAGPDAAHLETFNVLGRVTGGMDVVDRIAAVEVVPNAEGELSKPRETVYLERVEIEIAP